MSNLHFRLMSLGFKFRDLFTPRGKILEEVDIESGFRILDYGCGTGSYTVPAARLVGKTGRVYALDIHPLAIQQVKSRAVKKGLANIETILSDCPTGLPDNSIDVALLYDTFHSLSEPDAVLKELHRILKPGGILSFNDHHMKEEEGVLTGITGNGLFKLLTKGERVYNFQKVY